MLSRETLEVYRKMTPSKRLGLTLQAMRESTKWLLSGPKEVVDRRFELIGRENDARNRAMFEELQGSKGCILSLVRHQPRDSRNVESRLQAIIDLPHSII